MMILNTFLICTLSKSKNQSCFLTIHSILKSTFVKTRSETGSSENRFSVLFTFLIHLPCIESIFCCNCCTCYTYTNCQRYYTFLNGLNMRNDEEDRVGGGEKVMYIKKKTYLSFGRMKLSAENKCISFLLVFLNIIVRWYRQARQHSMIT